MEWFFLSDAGVRKLIGRNMHRVVSEQKVVALEDASSTVGNQLAPFAEYELAGDERGLLLNAKSRFSMAAVTFRFHARYPADAGKLYDAFYDRVHPTATPNSRYTGTWSSEDDSEELSIMGARWDDAAASESWDDGIGMAVLSASLVIPFKAPA